MRLSNNSIAGAGLLLFYALFCPITSSDSVLDVSALGHFRPQLALAQSSGEELQTEQPRVDNALAPPGMDYAPGPGPGPGPGLGPNQQNLYRPPSWNPNPAGTYDRADERADERYSGSTSYSSGEPGYYNRPFIPEPGQYFPGNNQEGYQDHRIYSNRPPVVAPAGLMLSASLQTSISTQVAKPGDYIQATIAENISLDGRGYIPAGTQIVGAVSESVAGRRLSRSGALSLEFSSLRMPDGRTIPIRGHLVGELGKYKDKGEGEQDLYRGEGWGAKIGQSLLRGGLGAGLGAGLGTAVGGIAGGGRGAGMGAWSGAAIGGGIGAADMLLRKGRDVIIPAGTTFKVQLDQPVNLTPQVYPGYGQPAQGMF